VGTTLGGRGLSVNLGKRGTYVNAGVPGTGLHARSRLGGGQGAGLAPGGSGAAPAGGGCAGCGGLALLMMLFMGFCSAIVSSPGGERTPSLLTVSDTAYSAPQQQRDALYAHGTMNVRTGAGTSFPVVRTLAPGERVEVGERDATGWAPVYDRYGGTAGYVYRASQNLRSYAPGPRTQRRARSERQPRRHPQGASALCRDGTYSYSANRRGTCSWHGGVAQWL
jgi:hypothetical protein